MRKDLKTVKDELSYTNEFLHQINDLNPHFIYAKDNDNKFVYVNKTMADFYQQPADEIIGQTPVGFYDTSQPLQNHHYKKYAPEKQKEFLSVSLKDKNDAPIHHELIRTPMIDKNGQIIGTLGVSIDVTERMKIEQQLRESELRYRKMIENNQVGVTTIRRGKFTSANKKFCQMAGYTPAEIKGMDITQIINLQDCETYRSQIEKIYSGEVQGGTFEHRYYHKNKSMGYALIHLQRLEIKGKPLEMLASVTDITELRIAQQEGRKNEEIYRQLFHQSFDGLEVHEFDKASSKIKNLLRNQKLKDLLGREDNELSSDSDIDILALSPPNQPNGKTSKEYLQEQKAYFKKHRKHSFEWRFLHKEGTPIDTEISLHQFQVAQKSILITLYRDKTQIKATEIALRKSQKIHQYLFDNALDGLEMVEHADDQSPKLILRNDKFRTLLGYENSELFPDNQNRAILELSPEYQPNGKPSKDLYEAHLKTFDQNNKVEFDWKFQRKNGEPIDVKVSVHGFELDGKKIIIALYKDITQELKQTQLINQNMKELNQKNQELQTIITSNQELEKFAYTVSHDLKQPIRSIVGFTQLLERSLKENIDDNQKEFINFIVSASLNMQTLIDDLLTYSRVKTANMKIEQIDLEKMMHIIQYELNQIIKDTNATIQIQNLPPTIQGDKTQIKQTFQNLITNGIKYHKKDTPPIIQINATEHPEHWQFSIKDNGIGIQPQFHQRIFQLFQKLHTKEQYEGSGLGLNICQKAINLHQGKIWLESIPDEGSTFYFTLPKNIQSPEKTQQS